MSSPAPPPRAAGVPIAGAQSAAQTSGAQTSATPAPGARTPAAQARPLAGVRVLDLTRLLPGPFASMVLADLGAEVDKVEDVGPGDYLRHMPPSVGGTSATFLALNRGKRSLCLDLKSPAGRDAFRRLLPRYDILFEQFRPGVLERLGLGHEALRAAHPRLIVCALTGYGQTGPLAQRAGHDLNYLARGGVLGSTGPVAGPPQVPGFQLADVSGALYAIIGMLTALRQRDATGEGSVVDISMMESAMGFAVATLAPALAGAPVSRGAEALTGGLALYRTYTTKDAKAVALGALEPKFAAALCSALGLPFDMSTLLPGPHQADLEAHLAARFAERTRDEWEAFAAEHEVCLEPVLLPEELLADAHVAARRMLLEVDSPGGPLRQLRTPVTPLDASPGPAPRQGEHTRAILREAGLDEGSIDALVASGAARV